MRILNIINEEINSLNEEYSNGVLYGYHVTHKNNLESIFKNGLKVGGAAMQGKGLYAFYYLDTDYNHDAKYYSTKSGGDIVIIKFSVPMNQILIFDPKIAKVVLGDEFLISNQIKKLDRHNNIIDRSAEMNNMSVEDFEKKINTRFLNNERNWWTSELISQYQELGAGRLMNGEYGMTYIIPYPSTLTILGYHDKLVDDYNNTTIDTELKTVKDDKIINTINQSENYNTLKQNININQLESITHINRLMSQFEEKQMTVRNNKEYDLYTKLIEEMRMLIIELKNLNNVTTDYSNKRGIA